MYMSYIMHIVYVFIIVYLQRKQMVILFCYGSYIYVVREAYFVYHDTDYSQSC